MSRRINALVACAVLAIATLPAHAKSADGSFVAPPDGFDTRRDGIDHGKLEMVEYDSTTVGLKHKARRSILRRVTRTTKNIRFCTFSTASAETRTSGRAAVRPM